MAKRSITVQIRNSTPIKISHATVFTGLRDPVFSAEGIPSEKMARLAEPVLIEDSYPMIWRVFFGVEKQKAKWFEGESPLFDDEIAAQDGISAPECLNLAEGTLTVEFQIVKRSQHAEILVLESSQQPVEDGAEQDWDRRTEWRVWLRAEARQGREYPYRLVSINRFKVEKNETDAGAEDKFVDIRDNGKLIYLDKSGGARGFVQVVPDAEKAAHWWFENDPQAEGGVVSFRYPAKVALFTGHLHQWVTLRGEFNDTQPRQYWFRAVVGTGAWEGSGVTFMSKESAARRIDNVDVFKLEFTPDKDPSDKGTYLLARDQDGDKGLPDDLAFGVKIRALELEWVLVPEEGMSSDLLVEFQPRSGGVPVVD